MNTARRVQEKIACPIYEELVDLQTECGNCVHFQGIDHDKEMKLCLCDWDGEDY